MKKLVPLLLLGMLLSGCPDAKNPNAPPNIPTPKAVSAHSLPLIATSPLGQHQA